MAALHPHQQVYFNTLVDTKTPGALAKRYDMDYWQVAHRQLLEHLIARYPGDILRVWPSERQSLILPQTDRDILIAHDRDRNADFYLNLSQYSYWRDTPPPIFHNIRAYGSDIAVILAPNSDAYRDHYRAEYNDIKANGTLLAQSAFDIYAHNGALHYINGNCASLPADAVTGISLHIFPADPADLPADSRARGFENRDFWIAGRLALYTHTAFLDGKCITRRPLPDYPIARIITGQKSMAGGDEWRSDIDLAAPADAQSDFDVHARDGVLVYLKENCVPADARARIFLHIFPTDPADLPADRREFGFVNFGFHFAAQGADTAGKCVYERELPDYPIARIRTGQNAAASGGDEWLVNIDLAAHAAAPAVHDGILAGDYGKPVAQARFELYLRDNALTYLKAPCAPADAHARLFLHITPTDPADLPTDRREFGFANFGFQFADHGARVGDKCVATRDLPDYPIERIRTGQDTAAGGGDEWRVNINLAAQALAQALYARIAAGDYGQPVAQARFDLYLSGNKLAYLKEPCAPADANGRFFLHITPADPAVLPADRRERGFANLDFQFADHGGYASGKCVATFDLPDYPIDRIRTGQFVSGKRQLWNAGFPARP